MTADLTRWNRAGLPKFDYVDGNAAVFLEHLRAKMIALYLRGLPADHELRQADYWFNLLRDAAHPAPAPALEAAARSGLDWAALYEGLADKPETKAARNLRLLDSYGAQSDDYAAEILRAAARAGHVLAGYVDAYMNESYLSTATQWSSLQKLGEMVNYAPVPAASAETSVALLLAEGAGTQAVAAGLAMSAQPPAGGAPLVFETLADVTCHPDLNAARQRRWSVNRTVLNLAGYCDWDLAGQDAPAPGALAVLSPAKMTEPSAKPTRIAQVRKGATEASRSILLEGPPGGTWRAGYAELWHAPQAAATGLPRSDPALTVVNVTGGALVAGSLVEIDRHQGGLAVAHVVWAEGARAGLASGSDISDIMGVRPLLSYPVQNGYIDTAPLLLKAFFLAGSTISAVSVDRDNLIQPSQIETGVYVLGGEYVFCRFLAPPGATVAGVLAETDDFRPVTRIADPPPVTPSLTNPVNTVGFAGKPPKALAEGAYFVAADAAGTLTALRVLGIRAEKDAHYIAFNKPAEDTDGLPVPPDRVTYFGPMTRVLRLVDHDRSPAPLQETDGSIVLAGLSPEARALLRPGRSLIIEDERVPPLPAVQATLVDVITDPAELHGYGAGERDQAKIVFEGPGFSLAGFAEGWSVVRLNVVRAGHGERRPAKILGSGNGEKARQTFPLDVKGISHIADSGAASGVRPDIELRVDDVAWTHADLTDPEAEDTASFSVRTREDETYDIVLRRRLPSGQNNVRLAWHRVGSGRTGNDLPAGSFTKPKTKHRFVAAIRQPFATAGGSDREAAESIRTNAGAGIAANDRAVSLEDFTRLARLHASVWDARAERLVTSGRGDAVAITVVPVDGADLTPTVSEAIGTYVTDRALPGVRISLRPFRKLHVTIDAVLRVDPAQFVALDVADAARAALTEAFGLSVRKLAQPLFTTEVLGILETVPGAETATATLAVHPATPASAGQVYASGTGAVRALYPDPDQVAYLAATADISIRTEAL